MNTANIIKELRQQTGMNRREFSEYTKIPVRVILQIEYFLSPQIHSN